ncbi:hypothetical protein [Rouxiella sp. Mn2063]|uniref:transcriptional antitermination N peptide n=1 Tax=Rouxiella sp. Mn2063 TaxID=3395262 RepID=UPI003BBC8F17
MNRNQRRMAAYNARKAAESMKDVKLQKSIGIALAGCSSRVYKAVNSAAARIKTEASADNICLPQVAIYNAGHRKQSEVMTAR